MPESVTPSSSTAGTVLAELDRRIAARSILEHPFYQAWNAGELSREQVSVYAARYFPHVEAFPAYLENALQGTEDEVICTELLDNLREEREVPKSHPELWLDFADGMGADRESVAAAPASPATAATVETFTELSKGTTAEALTALYAYESQQPQVSTTKAQGLGKHYGVTDSSTLAYFEVHAEADLRHRQGERDALARCLEAGASAEEIYAAADRALSAYWGLLDGVCDDIGLSC